MLLWFVVATKIREGATRKQPKTRRKDTNTRNTTERVNVLSCCSLVVKERYLVPKRLFRGPLTLTSKMRLLLRR
jgi:hypothetical protein